MNDQSRRAAVLDKARALTEKAMDEGRELTSSEGDQVRAAIDEVRQLDSRAKAAQLDAADAASKRILSSLDDMARGHHQRSALTGEHIAMTGAHARDLAARIIDTIPRTASGQKALVTGGTATTSTILLPEVIATGRPAQSVLDVLPARIVTPLYSFLRQSSRALAAAPVPAGTAKPVSDVGVVGVQNRLRVVATVSSALDHYLLEDNANLMAFVTDELVYAVRVAVEAEVLSGDGTGEHFTGVLNTSGIILQAFATDALTSVRKAITLLDGQNYSAGVIVLHANDWEKIELLTASTGSIDTRGVPIDPVARRLWGVPVVVNNTLPAKFGLVIGQGAVVVDHDGKLDVKWTDAVS
ncbi:MAG: phage major capsid protein, partial [Mycobacterium sp.]